MVFRLNWALLALSTLVPVAAQAQTGGQALPEPMVQAVRKAVLTHPEVQAIWNGFQAAQSEQAAARGGLWPKIDLQATVARQNLRTPAQDLGSFSSNSAELTLQQLLFDGGYTASEARRLGYAGLTRYYELAEISETKALDAFKAYIDVQRYRELVDAAKDNYQVLSELTGQIEERVSNGAGRGADLEQASGRLAQTQSDHVTQVTNLYNASVRYLHVMGELPPSKLPSLPEPFNVGPMPASADALLRDGFQGSPTLAAALENTRTYQQAVTSRRAAFMPRLDLNASALAGRNVDGDIGDTRDTTIALNLAANLYRGGADSAALDKASFQSQQARELQEQTCRNVRQTLSIAYNDMRSLSEQLKFRDQHRLSTEKSLQAYRQQFNIGQRTALDLLDSQSEYFEASQSYINVRYDQIAAQARTLAAMGQLVAALGSARADVPSAADVGQERTGIDPAELCEAITTEVEPIKIPTPERGPDSYVVLIPSPDGTVGRVIVQGAGGEQELSRDGQVALLDGSQTEVKVSPEQIQRDFAGAVAARPALPEQFTLYFNRGGARLTKASRALLPQLQARLKERRTLDIWLIGHTDTEGSDKGNQALGLRRAQAMAKIIRGWGHKDVAMSIESYGETSPQVPTADNVSEPRNRRADITLR